jgi:hypothetical protein
VRECDRWPKRDYRWVYLPSLESVSAVFVLLGCRGLGPRSVAVGVTELDEDTGPPLATGAGGPRAAETPGPRGPLSDWNGHAGGTVPSPASEWLSSESPPGTVLDVLPGRRREIQAKPEPASYPSPT